MPKGMEDPILSALKKYEHNPTQNDKKAVLLTPQGGYFLYENRFCSILDYELEFVSDSCQIQGKSVQQTIFLGILQDGFRAVGEQEYAPRLVSLIFHIDLGDGELLRGILLAVGEGVRFTLFCDSSVEELYRLSRRIGLVSEIRVPPDHMIRQYAEKLRRNDLHGLTGLYLKGNRLNSVPKEHFLR